MICCLGVLLWFRLVCGVSAACGVRACPGRSPSTLVLGLSHQVVVQEQVAWLDSRHGHLPAGWVAGGWAGRRSVEPGC